MTAQTSTRKSEPRKWLGYYSRKRIVHQWMQLNMLACTDARRVLEVGPAMGLVTAMLDNAGYEVTTVDYTEQQFDCPRVPHIRGNMLELEAIELAGHDAILCCEMLEHVPYDMVDPVLAKFHASGARYLIVSVPHMAFQLTVDLYFNRHCFREYFSLKKFLFLQNFTPEPEYGHQWEIGYRGYSLKRWEKKLQGAGYRIVSRDFTEQCRSVFHLLERRR